MSGVPGEQLKRVAQMFATQKPATLIWCMGQTQHTVGTANVRASCIAAADDRQRRRPGHGRQHLPRPRQRAGRHRRRPRYRDAAVLLRPGRGRLEALVARLGGRLQLSGRPLRRQEDHGDARHPAHALVRCHHPAEGPGRPERQSQGDVHPGSCQQLDHAYSRIAERPEGARTAGGRRPASDDMGLARRQCRPQGQHVPAAGRDPVRMQGLARGLQPRAAVGRTDRQADLRIEGRSRGHVSHGQKARHRRPDVQEHQGREQSCRWPRTSCAR